MNLTRNQRLCEALHGYEIGGKLLYPEYPDLLMWAGAGKWRVFATPDYDRRGVISVEGSTEDGDSVSGPEVPYKHPLTAKQYLRLVRRYVETDPRQWGRLDNPTRAEHYRAASQTAVKAEKIIAAARRARGAERGRLLDEAEALVRESVEHGRAAGDTWMSYETSSGREEIEKLRGRQANPAWTKVFG